MSKKKLTVIFLVLLIITNALTFGFANVATIQLDKKVVIPRGEYEEIYSVYQDFSKVLVLENIIRENYLRDVDDENLIDGQLKGMVEALKDPYSQYMTAEEYTDFHEQSSGIYGGIGVIVTPGDDNFITVVSPIEGTPGEKAGLRPGDKIIRVDGKEFTADEMNAAVKVMKGEPNTEVTLSIMRKDRQGENKILDITLIREEIRLETVKSEIIDDNIGYIKISSFDELTDEDFIKSLNNLEKSNVAGLIIDLRYNPGGLLDVTSNIADQLLGDVDIVYTETKDGEREYLRSKKSMTDLPLVVLINEGSASASEILAGAIRDHDRGELIGTTTFGKGVVQRIRPLQDGSALKLTISEYFTPNGTNIHGIGIEPDIVVELPEDIEEIGTGNIEEDLQLQKALEVLKNKINKT